MRSSHQAPRRVVITGMGAVTPAGVGNTALAMALFTGQDLFEDLKQPWAIPPYHLGAIAHSIGARERISPNRLRRISRFSQMAVVAAMEALDSSRRDAAPESTGVVIGTGLGALEETVAFLSELLDEDPSKANPALFPSSVMNVAAAHISMELGLRGYNTTVNHKEISAELALMIAADVIRLGRAEMILVGGVDELNRPVHHAYRRFGALAPEKPRPYGLHRQGFLLGEGAGMMLVESSEHALNRGAPILAELKAIGVASDDRPLTAWGGMGENQQVIPFAVDASVEAIQSAIRDAGLHATEIDLVIGSGCGSSQLDELEAQALHRCFTSGSPRLTTPHGTIGTWMSSGSLRVLSGVFAISEGKIYPSVIRDAVDPRWSQLRLVTSAENSDLKHILVCGHATGGASAAVILSRWMT